MYSIYKKELRSYFCNMTGPIFISFILLWMGIFTVIINLKGQNQYFDYAVTNASLISYLSIPLLTMRSFAEERNLTTDRLLYSLPVRQTSIVFAKFLSMLTMLAIPTAIICTYPLILNLYAVAGTTNFAAAYGSILFYFLIGTVFIATGMFISTLTSNQVIAAVVNIALILVVTYSPTLASYLPGESIKTAWVLALVAVAVALIIYVVTKNIYAAGISCLAMLCAVLVLYLVKPELFSDLLIKVMSAISLFSGLNTLVSGLFSLSYVFYYLSLAALFVFLTVQSVERRRWS